MPLGIIYTVYSTIFFIYYLCRSFYSCSKLSKGVSAMLWVSRERLWPQAPLSPQLAASLGRVGRAQRERGPSQPWQEVTPSSPGWDPEAAAPLSLPPPSQGLKRVCEVHLPLQLPESEEIWTFSGEEESIGRSKPAWRLVMEHQAPAARAGNGTKSKPRVPLVSCLSLLVIALQAGDRVSWMELSCMRKSK